MRAKVVRVHAVGDRGVVGSPRVERHRWWRRTSPRSSRSWTSHRCRPPCVNEPPTMIWSPSHVAANGRARPLVRGRHCGFKLPSALNAARCWRAGAVDRGEVAGHVHHAAVGEMPRTQSVVSMPTCGSKVVSSAPVATSTAARFAAGSPFDRGELAADLELAAGDRERVDGRAVAADRDLEGLDAVAGRGVERADVRTSDRAAGARAHRWDSAAPTGTCRPCRCGRRPARSSTRRRSSSRWCRACC